MAENYKTDINIGCGKEVLLGIGRLNVRWFVKVISPLQSKSETVDYKNIRYIEAPAYHTLLNNTTMITRAKITDAAFDYQENVNGAPRSDEAFIDGAEWMQNEFVKDLWHDAKEEPDSDKPLLGHDLDGYAIYRWVGQEANWQDFAANSTLQKWCYISELLPSEPTSDIPICPWP